MAVWFKTRPKKSESKDLDTDGTVASEPLMSKRGNELPPIADRDPFRLPLSPPPYPKAVIVDEPCRSCKEAWCNYPEVKRMEITTFKTELEYAQLPQCSFDLEDLPLLQADGTLIDAIVPRNR
jgi:hypothetical protein